MPGLVLASAALLWIDRTVHGDNASLLTRIVENGFVAGLAGSFLSVAVVLLGVDVVSRGIEAAEAAAEQARWAQVEAAVQRRVRAFATGGMASIRELLGVRVGLAFFDDLPQDEASTQIGATRKTANLLRERTEEQVYGLNGTDWKAFIAGLRTMQSGGDRLMERERFLEPEQQRLLLALSDQAQSILSLYAVAPELYASLDELKVHVLGAMDEDIRRAWYANVARYTASIVDDLEALVLTTAGDRALPPQRIEVSP